MSGISSVGFNQPVSFNLPAQNSRVGVSSVAFQGDTEKQAKKNSHKILKALAVAAVAVGGYFVFKKRGKEIGAKVKDLTAKLKDFINNFGSKAKDVVKGTEEVAKGTQEAANGAKETVKIAEEVETVANTVSSITKEEAKAAAESISKPFTTSAEKINSSLGIDKAVNSAKESAAVFESQGLTEVEKQLNKADVVSQIAKPATTTRPTITFTEADVVAPAPKPQIKPQAKSNSATGFLGDATVAPASKLQAKPRPTIYFNGEEEVAQAAKPKVKQPKKSTKDLVPSKSKVIRDHSQYAPGSKHKGQGKIESKKARHNKKRIIEQSMYNE